MAEKVQEQSQKVEKQEKEKKKFQPAQVENEVLVRIYGYDMPGSKNIYTGLTKIKGISWAISNAVCLKLSFPRSKKISELSKADIVKIEEFLDKIEVPDFMKNRRKDRESGTSEHFYGTDLDLKREFDIKRLREIKSYRGIRHALKQPVRGQRTRSHFRVHKTVATGRKSKTTGVKK